MSDITMSPEKYIELLQMKKAELEHKQLALRALLERAQWFVENCSIHAQDQTEGNNFIRSKVQLLADIDAALEAEGAAGKI